MRLRMRVPLALAMALMPTAVTSQQSYAAATAASPSSSSKSLKQMCAPSSVEKVVCVYSDHSLANPVKVVPRYTEVWDSPSDPSGRAFRARLSPSAEFFIFKAEDYGWIEHRKSAKKPRNPVPVTRPMYTSVAKWPEIPASFDKKFALVSTAHAASAPISAPLPIDLADIPMPARQESENVPCPRTLSPGFVCYFTAPNQYAFKDSVPAKTEYSNLQRLPDNALYVSVHLGPPVNKRVYVQNEDLKLLTFYIEKKVVAPRAPAVAARPTPQRVRVDTVYQDRAVSDGRRIYKGSSKEPSRVDTVTKTVVRRDTVTRTNTVVQRVEVEGPVRYVPVEALKVKPSAGPSWFNRNKKWVIPVGLGAVGGGAYALISGSKSSSSAKVCVRVNSNVPC